MIKFKHERVSGVTAFIKIGALAILIGVLGGLIGVGFHELLDIAEKTRTNNPWLLYLLPIAGIIIIALYKLTRFEDNKGTNDIILSVRDEKRGISPLFMPLLFICTPITHLFGGSAGKEGAALQMGGSLGYNVGKICRSSNHERRLLTLCGMTSVFSAIFGTPIAAAFFPIEFVNVGVIYSAAIFPCLISSLTASLTARCFGVSGLLLPEIAIPDLDLKNILCSLAIAALTALVSILFCIIMEKYPHYLSKYIKNSYCRIFIGGLLVVGLTLLLGTYDYNGAGIGVIKKAVLGEVIPFAFAAKLILTVLTMGSGYKGGEIVPSLFIGATFGCAIAPLFGFSAPLAAVIGMIAMFCGVTNSPIASIFIGIELFGTSSLLYVALASATAFALSGNISLYSSQKVKFSKVRGFEL